MKNYGTIILAAFVVFACSSTTNTEETTDTSFDFPGGTNASLPHLTKGGDDNLYLSWVEKGDSNWVNFKYSMLDGNQWTEPELISGGDNWFVNWADYPMIAVDKDGNKVAHYLAKSASGTYSYDVNVVIKPAGITSWSPPIIPHKDGTPTEHGFVTILPQNDGTFHLNWLDGRNTGGSDHESGNGHGGGGAMTIRTAVLNMQGNLTEETELDSRVCDCCQTGGIMTSAGPVVVYRDRSDEEIRDMSFVRKINGNWTAPQPINEDGWKIAGCPVNGPRIAALGDQLVSAWFTAANETPTVKAAFFGSTNSFLDPVIIDNQKPLGRVDVIMLTESSALVSWLTNEEGKTVINARKVSKDGSLGEINTITETDGSRGSGFPQMEKAGDQIYFAWTNMEEGNSSILIKKISAME
ncbi:MAG: exo-alpha-sialidase [Cyclobacteriaceae bacterium]